MTQYIPGARRHLRRIETSLLSRMRGQASVGRSIARNDIEGSYLAVLAREVIPCCTGGVLPLL
ncbi:MAG: hypothetical protein QXT73_08755 [Candidatus Methanomethylicaceae archaeon]